MAFSYLVFAHTAQYSLKASAPQSCPSCAKACVQTAVSFNQDLTLGSQRRCDGKSLVNRQGKTVQIVMEVQTCDSFAKHGTGDSSPLHIRTK